MSEKQLKLQFAAAALQGLLAGGGGSHLADDELAEKSFDIAEEMLAEWRTRQVGPIKPKGGTGASRSR